MAKGNLLRSRYTLYFLLCLMIICSAGSCSVTDPAVKDQWATYLNEEYGYSFDHPPEVQVRESGKDSSSIQLLVDSDPLLEVSTKRDALPGDAQYFLDTPSSGQRRIGDLLWTEFVLPDGYCDGPNCSPPIYALRVEDAQTRYTITMTGQIATNELQDAILATFRFVE